MYDINHWIPAFAGMTEGLKSGICQEWQRGYRDGNPLFSSSSSFRRRPESRKRSQNTKWNPAYACLLQTDQSHTLRRSFPPEPGMYYINHWIPRRPVPDATTTTARLSSPNALHPCRRACACLPQAGRNDEGAATAQFFRGLPVSSKCSIRASVSCRAARRMKAASSRCDSSASVTAPLAMIPLNASQMTRS